MVHNAYRPGPKIVGYGHARIDKVGRLSVRMHDFTSPGYPPTASPRRVAAVAFSVNRCHAEPDVFKQQVPGVLDDESMTSLHYKKLHPNEPFISRSPETLLTRRHGGSPVACRPDRADSLSEAAIVADAYLQVPLRSVE